MKTFNKYQLLPGNKANVELNRRFTAINEAIDIYESAARYNKSRIFKQAWYMLKNGIAATFSQALKMAYANKQKFITAKLYNLEGLIAHLAATYDVEPKMEFWMNISQEQGCEIY